MIRIDECEILDGPDMPDEVVRRAYDDLFAIHRWLGDVRFVTRAIRNDPLPVRRILDVGCATGLVLQTVGHKLGVDVVGADIRPRHTVSAPVPIVRANACFDPLPSADVAFCMHLGHHLSEDELILLIRNVGRYCRRFILLDLVRHSLPLALFRLFVAPLICAIDAEDGQRSLRRAYTPDELSQLANTALAGSEARFRHSVAPLYVRQVLDISYGGAEAAHQPVGEVFAEEGECAR
jgi:2-polyprenyl-3-methyl-5-hydroxy-6-metoxy-1,4-benzoquinol methylase